MFQTGCVTVDRIVFTVSAVRLADGLEVEKPNYFDWDVNI